MSSVNDKSDDMYAKHTTSIAEVADLIDTMTDEQRLVLRGLVYIEDPKVQKEVDDKLAAADKKFAKSLEDYKRRRRVRRGHQAGVEEFEKGYQGYVAVRGQVRKLTVAGQETPARAANAKAVEIYQGLHDGLVAANDDSEKAASRAQRRDRRHLRSGRTLALILLVARPRHRRRHRVLRRDAPSAATSTSCSTASSRCRATAPPSCAAGLDADGRRAT